MVLFVQNKNLNKLIRSVYFQLIINSFVCVWGGGDNWAGFFLQTMNFKCQFINGKCQN